MTKQETLLTRAVGGSTLAPKQISTVSSKLGIGDESLTKIKIVCTIDPACLSGDTLRKMYRAGMNGAKINAAYGTIDQHRDMIETIQGITDIPIVIDTKGRPIVRHKKEGMKTRRARYLNSNTSH